jgi:hypothetical protein
MKQQRENSFMLVMEHPGPILENYYQMGSIDIVLADIIYHLSADKVL